MKRTIKKLLSGVLTLGLIATMLPGMSMTAKAAPNMKVTVVTAGENTSWKADDGTTALTANTSTDVYDSGSEVVAYLAVKPGFEITGGLTKADVTINKTTSGTKTKLNSGQYEVSALDAAENRYKVTIPTGTLAASDLLEFICNKAATPVTRNMSFVFVEADSATSDGAETATAKEDYKFNLTPKEGYYIASVTAKTKENGDIVTVSPTTFKDATATAEGTYEKESTVEGFTIATTTLTAMKDIEITVTTAKKKATVEKDGSVTATIENATDGAITNAASAKSVKWGEDYVVTAKGSFGPIENGEMFYEIVRQYAAGTDGTTKLKEANLRATWNGTGYVIPKVDGVVKITELNEKAGKYTVQQSNGVKSNPGIVATTDAATGEDLADSSASGFKLGETTPLTTADKDYVFEIEIEEGYMATDDLEIIVQVKGTADKELKLSKEEITAEVKGSTITCTIPKDALNVLKTPATHSIIVQSVAGIVEASTVSLEDVSNDTDYESELSIKPADDNAVVDDKVLVMPGEAVDVILTPPSGKVFMDGAVAECSNNKSYPVAIDGTVSIPKEDTGSVGSPVDLTLKVKKEYLLASPDPGNNGQTSGEGQPEDASTPGSAGPDGANSAQPGGTGSTGFADDNLIADYAKPYVKAAADAGIIKGVGDNRFDPLGTATRAQFATMVARAKGLKASKTSSKFADVVAPLNADLINGVIACEDLNPAIVQGYPDNSFQPNKAVSRAEGILMIWRAAGSPAYSGADKFNDMADWYKDAANWGADKGIVNGVGGNQFNGNGTLTRQDLATMLGRAIEKGVITAAQAQDIADKANTEDKTDEKTDAASEGESTEASGEKTEEKAAK